MVHALLEALYIGYGVHLLGDDESMDGYPEGSARVEMGDMNMGERAGACAISCDFVLWQSAVSSRIREI